MPQHNLAYIKPTCRYFRNYQINTSDNPHTQVHETSEISLGVSVQSSELQIQCVVPPQL